METMTQRENKVLFYNNNGEVVIVNNKITRISIRSSSGGSSIDFKTFYQFKTFLNNCQELLDMTEKEVGEPDENSN